jgi:hypothetical protein
MRARGAKSLEIAVDGADDRGELGEGDDEAIGGRGHGPRLARGQAAGNRRDPTRAAPRPRFTAARGASSILSCRPGASALKAPRARSAAGIGRFRNPKQMLIDRPTDLLAPRAEPASAVAGPGPRVNVAPGMTIPSESAPAGSRDKAFRCGKIWQFISRPIE